MAKEFPGSPVAKTLCFHCRSIGLIPCQGTKIPQAMQCSQIKHNKNKEKSFFLIKENIKIKMAR